MMFLQRKIFNFRHIFFLMLTTALVLSCLNLSGMQFYIILFNKEKASQWLAQKEVTPERTKSIAVKAKELCGPVPSGLMGSFEIKDPPLGVDLFTINTNLTLIRRVEHGGSFSPQTCRARHRIAIVVPYRDRLRNFKIFMWNMHRFLRRQEIEYTIYVVEQAFNGKFNKGVLMNAAFHEIFQLKNATNNRTFDCIMYHDVDLMPTDDTILYQCPVKSPRHYSSQVDKKDWSRHKEKYVLVGGVISYSPEHYRALNGYSNLYWGWGGEDDDMSIRMQKSGVGYERPSRHLVYTMTRHKPQARNPQRMTLLKEIRHNKRNFTKDGLNSVEYTLLDSTKFPLHTHLLIDVGKPK